jgi:hypothetical protein
MCLENNEIKKDKIGGVRKKQFVQFLSKTQREETLAYSGFIVVSVANCEYQVTLRRGFDALGLARTRTHTHTHTHTHTYRGNSSEIGDVGTKICQEYKPMS